MARKRNTVSSGSERAKVYRFRVTLEDTDPAVWRTFLAHENIELSELHVLIQLVMGWEGRHLFAFKIGNKSYTDSKGAAEVGMVDFNGLVLSDVIGDIRKFKYTYDFGDNWVHSIEIIEVLENDPRLKYPVCTGGQNACPPEDCGGVGGFEDLKETLAGEDSEEKDDLLSWLGGFFDPTTFDPNLVNRRCLWANSRM